MSMKKASSTISDLWPSFDDEVFFSALMMVLLDYSSIGTVFQILLPQVNFGVFLLVAARRIISTNNIARGMVRGSQVRFQSTKSTLSIHPPSHTSTPLPTKISFRPSVRVAPSFEPSSLTRSLARVMFLYMCSVVRDQLIASDLQIGLSRRDNEHAR
jgi:hypothetical protein